jgi:hypothetical protein
LEALEYAGSTVFRSVVDYDYFFGNINGSATVAASL